MERERDDRSHVDGLTPEAPLMAVAGQALDGGRRPWETPRLVALSASANAKNSLTGSGDVDQTYSGFPYGYS